MFFSTLLTLIALVPAADDAAAAELKKLAGAWEVILPADDTEARPFTLEIAGDRFTVHLGDDKRVKLKVVVDPTTNPPCIDLELEDGTKIEGIYRLEEGQLTFCIGQLNVKERPTKIPERSEGGVQVVRLKRKKS
jgi:uncharacterized protein (TIGR03067 family)